MAMPREFTVNGIGRVSIATPGIDGTFVPLPENSTEFAGLAFSIYAGHAILNKPQGREALRRVGEAVVQQWAARGHFTFAGDPRLMPSYLDEFLRSVQNDFPRIMIEDIGGADVMAEFRRMPIMRWDGNFWRFPPKDVGGLFFNRMKVAEMTAASAQSGNNNSHARKMSARYRSYLFSLALSVTHELTHFFVAYLAQGMNNDWSFTPPTVTHLNYAADQDDNGNARIGESGRRLESLLLGGSLEFYRDVQDDDGQAGIPFILDTAGLARRVHPQCVLDLVSRVPEFNELPLRTTGNPLTTQQRMSRGLLSLGNTQASGGQGGSFMRARFEGPMFDISAIELNRVARQPGYVPRSTRVA